MEPFKLHDQLKLGVATASTQIEGDNRNNSFYEFSLIKGRIKDDTTPFVANQHYKLYKEDIKLMADMHIQIYRMSVEWARIEPEEGKFDREAMDHYIDEISLLKEKGIKVLVTLHHFSNPIWFEHKGAFTKSENNRYFLDFVQYFARNIRGVADEFCTINEPNIYALTSYYKGVWPPAQKSMKLAKKVLKNLAICHIEAYRILHGEIPECRVGFANHMVYFAPKSKKNLLDRFQANYLQRVFQDSIMKAMAFGKRTSFIGNIKQKKGKYYDFIGINYYLRNEVHHLKAEANPNAPKNELGWEIYPEGLRAICKREHEIFGGDIYVTENGTCDSKDEIRPKYIYTHVKAISDLPYVKAYCHWTFIDNWEWAEGQTAKFGLVSLDYKTQERTIRKSGKMYTELIDSRGFTEEMIKKYL
ncbi:MAG: family 1 glycosylhydrolase [Bacilli bacterium]